MLICCGFVCLTNKSHILKQTTYNLNNEAQNTSADYMKGCISTCSAKSSQCGPQSGTKGGGGLLAEA